MPGCVERPGSNAGGCFVPFGFGVAAKWELPPKSYRPQFEIAERHLFNTLMRLKEEIEQRGSLMEDDPRTLPWRAGRYHVLPHGLGMAESPIQETFRGRSYFLEGLVHLFVRRNWKQALRQLWPDISRIWFARYCPPEPADFFRWRCVEGLNRVVSPKHSQPWDELVAAADEGEGKCIPPIARAWPHLVLLYILISAHRANSEVLRWLDMVLVGGV